MHSKEESLPFKPELYEERMSNSLEETDASPPERFRGLPRFTMRILGVFFGLSLLLNTFYILRDLRGRHTQGCEEDNFRFGYKTDFSKSRSQKLEK